MKRMAWVVALVAADLAGLAGWAHAQGVNSAQTLTQSMTVLQAAVLGVVEGLTEYLPVSSTGHLIITQYLLGVNDISKEAADAYAICIQAGAIIAVLYLYFGRIRSMMASLVKPDPVNRRLFLGVLVAFIPAAVLGVALKSPIIDKYLFGYWPVIGAWLVGGIVMLAIARQRRDIPPDAGKPLESLTLRGALFIGLLQCLSLWPGVSRSLTTIVAGALLGLSIPAAVEFSFLLGLVTLGAATLYEGIKDGPLMIATYGWVTPLVGLAVACLAAVISVKWMVGYLNRHGIALFGYYRIALAIIAAALIFIGVLR
ncbi:MAG: undecaprenyl-diphosphate phosphatase [Armatimonadota bacterium]